MRNIWFHEVEPEVQLLSFSFYGAAQSLVKDTHFLPNQTLLSVMLGGWVCVCLCVHVCLILSESRGCGAACLPTVIKRSHKEERPWWWRKSGVEVLCRVEVLWRVVHSGRTCLNGDRFV